jgi:hypothetical protein
MLRAMRKLARSLLMLFATASSLSFILQGRALAQDTSATAAFPADPSTPTQTPAAPAVSSPIPAQAAPTPAPSAPAPSSGPLPNATPSAPIYPPAQPDAPIYPTDPNSTTEPGNPGAGYPPPPPQDPNPGFKMPEISIRVDPFNLFLEGRLGLELEGQVYKWLTLELVPVFVTTKSPPTLNYEQYDSHLSQTSNGLGPISGAAIDAAFWFDGRPFRGYALRTGFTNYAYTYDADNQDGSHDSISHTEREFFVMLADQSRWGAFTIGGGVGLGYELNQQRRCFDDAGAATSSCADNGLLIKLNSSGTSVGDLNSALYPFDFLVRFSLGVVF